MEELVLYSTLTSFAGWHWMSRDWAFKLKKRWSVLVLNFVIVWRKTKKMRLYFHKKDI